MYEAQIIAGIFSNEKNASKAAGAFAELGVRSDEIEIIAQSKEHRDEGGYAGMLSNCGFSDSQAAYYNKPLCEGKVLVVVYEVANAAPVIDIFEAYQAEYNPNGPRNVREDVVDTTGGATDGASVGDQSGAVKTTDSRK